MELHKNWRQEEEACFLRALEVEVVAAFAELEAQVAEVEMHFVVDNGSFVDLEEVGEAADSLEEAADSVAVVEEPDIEGSCSVGNLVSFLEDLVNMHLVDKLAGGKADIGD